ncbi:hypothetical protein BC835DRAFT_1305815 [Cytidiella melzeri]|nr:hypothetical protein BC835DRAFT_1305815 [Cytidiella melzeri]
MPAAVVFTTFYNLVRDIWFGNGIFWVVVSGSINPRFLTESSNTSAEETRPARVVWMRQGVLWATSFAGWGTLWFRRKVCKRRTRKYMGPYFVLGHYYKHG